MRQTSESSELQRHSRLRSARSKVAALSLGLLSLSGCKVCLSFNTDTAEGKTEIAKEAARRAAVDESGTRIIHIPEASASVILDRSEVEGCRSKITALLDISFISPMRQPNGDELKKYELQEYELSKDDHPWTKLVAGPDGNIGLKLKGDALALEFKCSKATGVHESVYCTGGETDPEGLDKKIAAAVTKAKEAKEAEERKEEESLAKEAVAKEAVAKKTASAASPAKPKTTPKETVPTVFPEEISVSPEIAEKLKQLEPALVTQLVSNFEYLKSLARELAGEKWKMAIEKILSEIDKNAQFGNIHRLNIIYPLKYLLAQHPDKITEVANKLSVKL
ncbi:MAG: hypothetical protein V1880_01605 [Patescibacteria group bacterium]